jgi:hypothetical protein
MGHDVSTAQDEGLLGQPDYRVAMAASNGSRLLFTLDVEFADLRKYPPGSHPGIVLFRPRSMGPLNVNRFVSRFFEVTQLSKLARCTTVVEPDRLRVRKPNDREEEEN